MSETDIEITRRQTGKLHYLPSGKHHKIRVKTKYVCHMLEVEDLNFHHDSAVMLPDYGTSHPQEGTTPEQERITGLAVLYACFRHARQHPDQSALVVGHTDRSGSTSYNQALSELRADNVLFALKGDREGWVNIALQKSKVEDYQQILLWLTHGLGWHCDPGGKTNVHDARTRQAVEDFQRQYNDRFSASISVDGGVGRETWRAFFDVYMQELRYALGTDEAGLTEAQQSLRFMSCEAIGCGEEFPITPERQENYKSPIDRRVEILFFDPGEEPAVNCGAPRGACVELYEKKMYCVTPIPVDPLPLPSGVAVHVQLQLFFKDPDPSNNDRTFPKDCPVTVAYADGTSEQKQLGQDGLLDFFALREKQAFTLQFQFDQVYYIASPPPTILEPDQLVAESGIASFLQDNSDHRVFKLPQDWRLAESTWQVTGTTAFDTTDHYFKPLGDQSITNIGSAATPVKLLLDPNWQYLKFLYFDRWIKRTLSIPRVMVEGFRQASATADAPDTRSNWTTDPEACQCLPWILRDPPKPDRDALVQFRTEARTFIEASGDSSNFSRRLVTARSGSGGASSTDPGLNAGATSSFDFDTPAANRLAYYDLPGVWKSQTYFARLSGGSGAPPARVGPYEDLAADATTNDKPLLFSLDDMVLSEASLDPINWVPDTQARNRVALFCNTFARSGPSSANLSSMGLYKPDSGNNQDYFTQRPSDETTRNYIADYADWTRLVITQGSLFDVFDRRTPDRAGGVVGARAAVRWVDLTTSPNFVPHVGSTPGATGVMASRPSVIRHANHPFFIVQPFYEQRHDRWSTPSVRTDDKGIGRFDLALLRCCAVDSDNVTEVGMCLNFFRFFFNFNPSFKPSFNKVTGTALGLSGTPALAWVNTAIRNLLRRWNDRDGTHNPGLASIVPTSSSSLPFRANTRWFAQDLPGAIAHYEVGVFQDPSTPGGVRAYMNSSKGQGALDQSDNASSSSGRFTFAHETGHGGSLNDEYIEGTTPALSPALPNPRLRGFDSFTPGSPFFEDVNGMMRANRKIRARYFWHLAEWLRGLEGGSVDFEVQHGTHTFTLPHHAQAPQRSYVNWPFREEINKNHGAHGRFDVFLYPLGQDGYSVDVWPTRVGHTPAFDGIIVVVVKMKFNFDISNKTNIHTLLTGIHGRINRRFNEKFYATGSVGGVPFSRCLVYFSPRYWSNNYSKKDPTDDDPHIRIDMKESGAPEWDSGLFSDNHLLEFPRSQPSHVFARFFGHMIGLADGTMDTATSYEPLITGVLPGGRVHGL